MIKQLYLPACICVFLAVIMGCEKSDGSSVGSEKPHLEGNLYYTWADEGTLKLALSTGEKSVFLSADLKQNGFFLNKAQNKVLVLSDIEGDYENELFSVIAVPEGTLIAEVKVDKGGPQWLRTSAIIAR